MEIQFTPEQEARLAQIASVEGIAPARLVQDAALRLIEDDARFRSAVRKGIDQADRGEFIEEAEMDARLHEESRALENAGNLQKLCPECGHRFKGHGWDGIDAHWRSSHEAVMPYEEAWPLIRTGNYDAQLADDLEDLRIAEQRLTELRAGRSRTHSLDEVERALGLVD
jgi:predicted DNA-binding protein